MIKDTLPSTIGDIEPVRTIDTPHKSSVSWQVLKRQELLNCDPWLKVHRETVQTSSGMVIDDYHRLEMPDHVVIYPRTKDGMVATLVQYKHGIGQEALTLPGGMVDAGEAPLMSAQRELQEETGLVSPRWYLLGKFCVNGNYGAGNGYYYLANDCTLQHPETSEDYEETRLQWHHPDHLTRLLNTGKIHLMHHALAVALMRSFETDP